MSVSRIIQICRNVKTKKNNPLQCFGQDEVHATESLAWENSRHFRSTPPLVSREMSAALRLYYRLQNSPYFCVNSTTHEQSNKSWKRRETGERHEKYVFFCSLDFYALRACEARALCWSYSTLNRFWEKNRLFCSLAILESYDFLDAHRSKLM